VVTVENLRDVQAETRRLLSVFVAGLFLASLGGVWFAQRAPARPAAVAAPAVAVTTTVPPTTTTTAPPVAAASAAQRSRPTDVPPDPYAAEPVREIGTIEIPKIGLVHPIMEGITLRNIDHGPSHWPGTAMPGDVGNTVFAGHRVTHTHPFLRIDALEPGDEVIFTIGAVRSVYVVTSHEIVTPKNLGIVNQTTTKTGTLFACHPPHSASFRYVVHLALK
jgi:sortase A